MAPKRRRSNSIDEAGAISVLQRTLERQAAPLVELGIGDDAAVLKRPSQRLVWSIDSSEESVHFDLRWLSVREAAGRAFVAAISDLAAMGATPVAALCAVSVPPDVSRKQLAAIAAGQAKEASRYGCPVSGGNISRSTRFAFSTTVLGQCERPYLRSGAKAGDEVWLFGEVGRAALGLTLLQRGVDIRLLPATCRAAARACIRAWRQPVALVRRASQLGRVASALIDVSDGVGSEARHVATASRVRVTLDADALLSSLPLAVKQLAAELEVDALEAVLKGGEDYALLCTGKPRRRPSDAYLIGHVTTGSGAWLKTKRRMRRLGAGFDHLRSPP